MKSVLRLMSFALLPLAAHSAFATEKLPSSGLGQSWPNAPDVSASPDYHVYVFERGGLRYVQVNDVSGTVRAAVVSTGSDVIGLPIGVDASRLATPSEAGTVVADAAGVTVYADQAVKLVVSPQADGTARLQATTGDCTNPRECSWGLQ
ncbi:hypothetical protein FHW69_003065 [Luteibacter sp. Sphag1AF]|uniref:hypothetical protein n=1 Tax=Luteibacter sp. Sphag1AF TaxID=2587031 RepID=UPI001621CC82|nr:hypothetical protein [Luteibacter sp. Sphag1AF]MBB3228430.1 hypothetical protein [Luteibacter sp. Sphag1AF]